MRDDRKGQIAVIFASRRTAADAAGHGAADAADHDAADADGYAAAAAAMDALAAEQPGYRGIDATRGGDGFGITVSYWADDAAAIAWRDHPEHLAIREKGRARWYDSYTVAVARVERSYDWTRR